MGENKCFSCAECCKLLKLTVAIEGEIKEWFTVHFGRSISHVTFQIKHNCMQLDENGKCKIYESPERPSVCKDHFCNRGKNELIELSFETKKEDI